MTADESSPARADAAPLPRQSKDQPHEGVFGIAAAVSIGSAVVMVTYVSLALVLAMLGWYATWLAGLLTTIVLSAAAVALNARPPVRPVREIVSLAGWVWDAGTIVGSLALAGWSTRHTAQHLIIDRDPGSYASTARWLSRTGQLWVDAPSGLLAEIDGIDRSGPAVYDMGGGRLEFQFSHGPSTVMAAAYDVAGSRGLFAATLIVGAVGLVAVYALMRRIGVAAPVAAALSLTFGISQPWLYVTRDTFSEAYAVVAVLTGATLLLEAWTRRIAILQWAAGFLIGGVVLFRIDGLVYLIALIAACGVAVWFGRGAAAAWRPLGGAAVPLAIGIADHLWFSGDYRSGLADETTLLAIGCIVALGALSAATWWRQRQPARPPEPARTHRATIVARALAFATAALVLAMWLVRPVIDTPRTSTIYLNVEAFQARQGLEVDGGRSYAELSVAQIGWYFGPVLLILAAAGVALLVHRTLARRDLVAVAFTTLVVVSAPLYLLRPSITPDHPWAMRRHVPMVLPVTLLVAGLAITAVFAVVARRSQPVAGAIAGALIAGIVLPTAWSTWPVRDMSSQRNLHPAVEQICSQVPDDAAFVVLDRVRMTMTVRAWCGNEAAVATPEVAVEVMRAARQRCEPLVMAAADAAFLDAVIAQQEGTFEPPATVSAELGPYAVEAIGRAADEVALEPFTLTLRSLADDPDCTAG